MLYVQHNITIVIVRSTQVVLAIRELHYRCGEKRHRLFTSPRPVNHLFVPNPITPNNNVPSARTHHSNPFTPIRIKS